MAITMDWVPTILALAGVASGPTTFDGVDLGPAFAGEHDHAERTLFWRTQDMAAARRGPWKYVRSGDDAYLANLVEDITENANFRRTHPEAFAGLEQAFREWESGILPIPPEGRRAPWEEIVRRKRSLA
jgi:arylsulfatase A-like enzyme